MEIRRWYYYVIFINCVIIKYVDGKTVSLNEVITAESQQKEAIKPSLLPKSTGASKRYSLFKGLRAPSRIKDFIESGFSTKRKFEDHTYLGGNILTPLKYKKTYLIKNPLKPRKLKLLQKSKYKRKNKSAKREINGNVELKHKYIPLLKSLSMLFDNILNTDSSESYEVTTKKYKRNRFYFEDTFEVPSGSDSTLTESESQEETITFSAPPTTAISIVTETPTTTTATSTTANIITTRDFSTIRQNKNIPILLPRNTFSGRGDDNGYGEGSSATRHGDVEGNITRSYRDHEHAAGCGGNETCTESDEENTHGVTRDDARGFRLSGSTGNRNNTGLFPKRNSTHIENILETKTTDDDNRENQFQNRRNETESGRILQKPIRQYVGLRGIVSNDFSKTTEFVQPKEIREEIVVNVTHDSSGYQRITDEGSKTAKEVQKARTRYETMMLMNNLNFTTTQLNTPKKKSPVMLVFDGYSSVKRKNGQNKFAEKSIHIHS